MEQQAASVERVIENVQMEDGRTIEFAGKRKMLKDHEIDQHGAVHLHFAFRNGRVLNWVVPKSLILKFAGHGAEQKLGDETAGLEDVDDQVEAVENMMERLEKGGLEAWTVRRESTGLAGTSVLLKALVQLTGKPVEKVKEYLKGLSAAEKTALRASEKVAPIVRKIEAEKAQKGAPIDTEALLARI